MISLRGQISVKRLSGRLSISKLSEVKIALQDKAVTPTTADQIIEADKGFDGLGVVTVAGDENMVPENIKFGKIIFGVEGSYSPGMTMFDTVAAGEIPIIYHGIADTVLAFGFTIETSATGTEYTEE